MKTKKRGSALPVKTDNDASCRSRLSFADIYVSEISETRDFVRAIFEDFRGASDDTRTGRSLAARRG